MRLDRNEKGRGKYAIINLRKLEAMRVDPIIGLPSERISVHDVENAIELLERTGLIEYGEPGTENEFFVMMLKDVGAAAALNQYKAVYYGKGEDPEYAMDISELVQRAGPNSPWCKKPD
jgi:hypothetical protein